MKMSKLGYFSEFLLFPPLFVFAMLLAFRRSIPPHPIIWATVYVVGLVGWTLIEYLLHRALFHHAPILARIHELHHNSPQDLIGTPAWVSALIGLILVAGPLCVVLGFDLGIEQNRQNDLQNGLPSPHPTGGESYRNQMAGGPGFEPRFSESESVNLY